PGDDVLAALKPFGFFRCDRLLDVFGEVRLESAHQDRARRDLTRRAVLPRHGKFGPFSHKLAVAFCYRSLEPLIPLREVLGLNRYCSSEEQRGDFHSAWSPSTRT